MKVSVMEAESENIGVIETMTLTWCTIFSDSAYTYISNVYKNSFCNLKREVIGYSFASSPFFPSFFLNFELQRDFDLQSPRIEI